MNHRLALYIFRNSLTAFLFTSVVVTFVVLFVQSFKLLSFVIDNSGTMFVFFKLMSLMLPAFLPLLLPLSLGIGVLFVYHKFAIDSELVVMRAAGVDPWRLMRPALALAGLVVLFGYILTLWITPTANRELVALQYKVKSNYSVALVKAGTFNDLAEGLTFYVRARGKNGELQDILIHDVRKPETPVTIMAESGQFTATEGEPQIIVFHGKRQELDKASGHLSQLDFDRYVLDLQMLRSTTNDRIADPRELSMTDLLNPPTDATRRRGALDVYTAELHQRLSTPLLALSYTLIALTTVLAGAFNRRGMTPRILMAAAAIVAVQATTLSLGSLISKQSVMIPLLYVAVLAPVPPCLLLLGPPLWRLRLCRWGTAS